MPTSHTQNPFQAKAQAMIHGFENFPIPNTQLLIRHEELTPQQLVQKFQDMVQTIQAVADADARYKAALRVCERALPSYHLFYDATAVALRAHFGSNRAMLARFGIHVPQHRRGQPEVEVIVTRPEVAEVVEEVEVVTEEPDQAPRPEAKPPLEVVGQGPGRDPKPSPEAPGRRREPRGRPAGPRSGPAGRRPPRRAPPRRDSRR